MMEGARTTAGKVADVAAPAAGATVSGATLFGFNVPELIQYATLVLLVLQIVWWLYKLTTATKGQDNGSIVAQAGEPTREADGGAAGSARRH